MRFRYRECKTLKEFHKIIRKYIKYTVGTGYQYRRTKSAGRKYHKFRWENKKYVWLSVKFIGLDAINSPELKKESLKRFDVFDHRSGKMITVDSNLKHIIKDAKEHYGEIFTDKRDENIKWKFVGIEITNEDYYYVYQRVDNPEKYFFSTCVGSYNEGFIEGDCE